MLCLLIISVTELLHIRCQSFFKILDQEKMLPFGCSEIFRDLKEGLLLENLNNYSNDTLRPFIPLLMTSAFQRDSSIGLEDPYLVR